MAKVNDINNEKQENNIREMETTMTKLSEKVKQDSFSSNSSMFKDYYKGDPNFEGEDLYKDKTKKDDALRIKSIKKILKILLFLL